MADTDIVQVIEETRVDARSLSEFIYKPASFMVTRRLAPPMNTLQFYIDRFNTLDGDFKSSVSTAVSSLNRSVAEADGKVAYIETTVQDAINNTAVEGGVLADTFVTMTKKSPTAIARNLRDVSSDIISVKDFGAKGDGVTDDQPAIQKAVDYIESIGGGVLHLPKGRYIVKSPIIWKTKVSMYGDGMSASVIASVGNLFTAIKNTLQGNSSGTTENVQPLEDVTFADFAIDCSGLTYDKASVEGKGFFILYMLRARFLNIYVHDSIGTGIGCDFLVDTLMHGCVVERAGRNWYNGGTGGGQSGIGVGTGWKDAESLTISDCFVRDCGNYGIFVETQQGANQTRYPTGCRVVNCYAEGNGYNYGNKGSGGVMWIGCESKGAKTAGFALSQNARGDIIDGCKVYDSEKEGILVNFYNGDLTLKNTEVFNNGRDGIYIKSQGTTGDFANDFHISNCIIKNNGYSGIVFAGANREIRNFSVRGCTIRGNGTALSSGNRQGIFMVNSLRSGVIANNWIGNDIDGTVQTEAIKTNFSTISELDVVDNIFVRPIGSAVAISGEDVRINRNHGHNNKAYAYSVSLSESPATYTAGKSDETLYLSGENIRVDIGSTIIVQSVPQAAIQVPANQSIVVRYDAITMARKTY